MFCRKCGKEISDDSDFCYKCGARVVVIGNSERSVPAAVNLEKDKLLEEKHTVSLEKTPIPIIKEYTQKQTTSGTSSEPVSTSSSHQCEFCGTEVFNSEEFCSQCNAPNHDYKGKKEGNMEIPQETSTQPTSNKCKICGKELLDNEEFCSWCDTPNPNYNGPRSPRKTVVANRPRKINRVPYKYSDEYLSLKRGTGIAIYVIVGLVIIIMILSGNATCEGGDIYTDDRGIGIYVGIVIGLAVLRLIFLGICKASHRND